MKQKSKLSITTVIRSMLLADNSLQSLVADKIFPLCAPQDTEGDFILYKREDFTVAYNQMGKTGDACKVYLNVISKDYDRSQTIAECVYSILEGNYDDGMRIRLMDSTEDFEDGKYIQVLLFSIE